MTFAWPWCFTLVLPLAAAAWMMFRRHRKTGAILFPALESLPRPGFSPRMFAASAAPYIHTAALALLIVAAARPQSATSRSSRTTDSIAIAMAVDVSGSMEERDMTPKGSAPLTRLDVVKDLFAKFVEKRPDDLVSLVTFGGYAQALTPLTADHAAVLHVLKGVKIAGSSYDRSGGIIDRMETMTAIGDGILGALDRVKDAAVKSKTIILLSDGMQNMPSSALPEDAARAAAALGVKIYTIGVGRVIEMRDIFGNVVRRDGYDEAQLKSIAAATGGKYFAATGRDALEKALAEIDKLEKTTIETPVYTRKHEHFAPFLVSGAVLAFLAAAAQMAATRRIA